MRAWVVMTALPPTLGHLALIEFAEQVADGAEVVVCTQPGEPLVEARVAALRQATHGRRVQIHHFHQTVQQEPTGADDHAFWTMWRDILRGFGQQPGDLIVASEAYGAELARATASDFLPFDLGRVLVSAKATAVRDDPAGHIAAVIAEFQPQLIHRVTLFGAESVGKTTMTGQLARRMNGHQVFEYARPYLELPSIGSEVTGAKMEHIWRGQRALQRLRLLDKPFIFYDTDLFSTVGYWQQWSPQTVPSQLVTDAAADASDLYLVLASNIPFEPDPLRYGGDVRETPDEYWIALCERYGLNYQVITASDPEERLAQAERAVQQQYRDWVAALHSFRRQGAEYATIG